MPHITIDLIQGIVSLLIATLSLAFGVQKYINGQITPLKVSIDKIEADVLKAETEHTLERAKNDESRIETRNTLEHIRTQLINIALQQTELRTSLFGSTGDNGMNSSIKTLQRDVLGIQLEHAKHIGKDSK